MFRYLSSKSEERELGFGRTLTTEGRLMNADGSFNVVRERSTIWDNTYNHLITMPSWIFSLVLLLSFILINCFFASIYCLIGIEGLNGIVPNTSIVNFFNAFFFSSQTLTTVGYGHISPNGWGTSIAASFESFIGLLLFALISGLLYGRFSRPSAKIIFSENALISPYKGNNGLMFRLINARRSEMIETDAQVILTVNQPDENGNISRRFYTLDLEISKLSFFSLSWTIVHPISEKSPLFGFSETDFKETNLELMILVKGTEDTNQQTVHARTSYVADEIIWNAKFLPIITKNAKQVPKVMTTKVSHYEKLDTL